MEQFGIPRPLARLISGYLFGFKSDDIIRELLNFIENLQITPNIIFYDLSSSPILPDTESREYINKHSYKLFIELMNQYDSEKYSIIEKLISMMHSDVINLSYKHLYMDLNLLDAVAIQACITKNKLFLDHFMCRVINKSGHQMHFRCQESGDRKSYLSPDVLFIAGRDIMEYFAQIDDIDSLDFIITKISSIEDYANGNGTYEFMDYCEYYIKLGNLPKLAQYRKKYLADHFIKFQPVEVQN